MSESVLNELPDGWEHVPLKDAVHIILGQSPSSTTYNQEGEGLPFFQGKTEFGEIYPTVRKWCTEPKKIAEKEDVLVSVRAPVGPTNLAPYECAIGRGLAALRPLGGSESKYFLYLIRRYQDKLASLGTGTTFEAISGDTLKNFMVPLAPPEQQKRIVAKIEELFSHIDAGIEALKKAKQLLKQYRQSVLKAAVTGELTKDLPGRQAGWRDSSFRNISDKRVPEKSNAYFAYVLECGDGSLYKGFSQDLFARINRHLEGRGAKWTQEHKPVALIHFEEFFTEKEAVEREKYFKSGSGREWLNEVREQQNEKYEPASQLLERILKERREKWEQQQFEQFKAKGKMPKDDKWKEKYKEPLLPEFEHVNEIPEIPDTWEWVTLSQLTSYVKDGPHYSPKYAEEGIPFITGGNVRPEGVDFEYCKFITKELYEELSKRCKPELNDILYTKGGTTGIARVNTYDIEFNVWVHVAVLRLVSTDLIEPFYMQHSLNSQLCYTQSQKYTHGVGNQDLGLTRMIKICLALPPVDEQREIIEIIDEKMSSITRVEEQIDNLLVIGEKNKQSVLASAFSGRLNEVRR